MASPALAIQNPNIAGNFMGGMTHAQDMQSGQIRNQLMQQQMAQQQAEAAKAQEYQNLLSQYLGQGTMNTLGNQQPEQTQIANQLMAMNPERTSQIMGFQQQQQAQQQQNLQQRAQTTVRAAQYVLKSEAPKSTLKIGFPEMVESLAQNGIDIDQLDDDAVRTMAQRALEQFGPIAGVSPEGFGGGRVQSTQILEDGTIAYMTSDGQLVRTGERARNPLQIAEVEGGKVLVDRLGGRTQQLSTLGGEAGAAREMASAQAQGGQMLTPDASGTLTPIAGSPEARKQEKERKAEAQRQENIALAGGTVVQDLERGLELLKKYPSTAAGPLTALQPKRFGTPAHQMQQFVDSVASNIGIDRLQAMRESSPTGGALGQVPVQQQMRLEQLLGSLQIDQPSDVLEDNMKRVQNIYLDIIHGTGNGPPRKRLSFDESGKSVKGGAPWRGDAEIKRYEPGQGSPQAQQVPQQQAPITATGPNGQKLILQNGQWVPFSG